MISFNYEINFGLDNEKVLSNWISEVIKSEGFVVGEIAYNFCSDDYLLQLNREFLRHDTLTDIISFDYGVGKQINGEIYISVERVRENSEKFEVNFSEELHRVMVHGVLHYCGYKDKSGTESRVMRDKENHYLSKL